jgi:hypothetical protein
MWGALSGERTGMQFKTAAGPRQRSHSFSGPITLGLPIVFYFLGFETPHHLLVEVEVEIKVKLRRRSVGQSVLASGQWPDFCLLYITLWQLRVP